MYKTEHVPVLLYEAIDNLKVIKDGLYLDCNLGGGGHTKKILENEGIVIGIDVDKDAIETCTLKYRKEIDSKRLIIVNDNFRNIEQILKNINLKGPVLDGVLYDLGASMYQFKEAQKGFSFNDNTRLDMRMDENLNVTAEDIIKISSVNELSSIIQEYGEDPNHKRYAQAIKELYQKNNNVTAKDISEKIYSISKPHNSKIHPATRVFQALRIVVNSELDNLKESLDRVIPLIKANGRLVIITFHSLEDALAKEYTESPYLKVINTKPIVASEDEILINPSSRSAKLRCYEKL